MKKKYRDITVDGVAYAWMVRLDSLLIWKDKKLIISLDASHCIITPQVVADTIRKHQNT